MVLLPMGLSKNSQEERPKAFLVSDHPEDRTVLFNSPGGNITCNPPTGTDVTASRAELLPGNPCLALEPGPAAPLDALTRG
ncbi:unnamed protein product [Gadus morhua 'NCC']